MLGALPGRVLRGELCLDGREGLDGGERVMSPLVGDAAPGEVPDVEGLAEQALQVVGPECPGRTLGGPLRAQASLLKLLGELTEV